MASKRTYWAITALGIGPEGTVDGTGVKAATYLKGVQSVGISTNFNLEQVFQLGQLEIYQDVEEVPDIEISIEKVLDDNPTAYQKAIGQPTVVSGTTTTDLSSGGTVLTLTGVQNNKCDAYLTIHPDTAENAGDSGSGQNVESFVWCSGMYVSSVSFNFPSDGNFTESVTLVGNHKKWYAGGASYTLSGAPTSAALQTGDIMRRQNFELDKIPASISPGGTAGFEDKGHPVIQNVTVSTDFGREAINALGSKLPYHRYVTFPVEVTCEIEVVINDAKAQDIDALPLADSNVSEEEIKIKIWDEPTASVAGDHSGIHAQGTNLRHTIDLGTKNKITSITYGGGDTGGGNATYSYSYRNFNKLDYKYN
jgi:hypothetical protein